MITAHKPMVDLHLSVIMRKHINLTSRWNRDNVNHSCTHLLFIESGTAYLRAKKQTIIMEPGKVYLVPSRLLFSYGCTKHTQLGFLIRFESAPNTDALSKIGQICSIAYTPEEYAALLECFDKQDYLSQIRLHSLLLDTIYRIGKAYNFIPIPIHNYSDTVSNATSYISANLRADLTAAEISKSLWISESKLRNDFKRQMHMTIGKYIEQCIFMKAQNLLKNSCIPINQICQQLGFCDHSYFSGRFKQRYGITPSQYRKQLLTERT